MMYTYSFEVITKQLFYIVKRYKYCFYDEFVLYLNISGFCKHISKTKLFKSSSNEQTM